MLPFKDSELYCCICSGYKRTELFFPKFLTPEEINTIICVRVLVIGQWSKSFLQAVQRGQSADGIVEVLIGLGRVETGGDIVA